MDLERLERIAVEPAAAAPPPPPGSFSLKIAYSPRLSRWKLWVKWLFCIPLYFAMSIYGLGAGVVAFIAFFVILITGRYPLGLFVFVRDYVNFQYRVMGYYPLLVADQWKVNENHAVRLEVVPPERLSRLQLLVKLPSLVFSIANTLSSFGLFAAYLFAVPAWFGILILGRYPRPLFNIVTSIMGWSAGITTWQFFMTDNWSVFGRTLGPRLFSIIVGGFLAIVVPIFWVLSITGGFAEVMGDRFGGIFSAIEGQETVDKFMKAGRDGDREEAGKLFEDTPAAQQEARTLLNDAQLFSGYRALSFGTFDVFERPDGRRGMEIEGVMVFRGNSTRSFHATLVKNESKWQLTSVTILRAR
jgi:hypothetical protein